MSIQRLTKNRMFLTALFIFLTVFLAFGLGYLMGSESDKAPIIIELNNSFEEMSDSN